MRYRLVNKSRQKKKTTEPPLCQPRYRLVNKSLLKKENQNNKTTNCHNDDRR